MAIRRVFSVAVVAALLGTGLVTAGCDALKSFAAAPSVQLPEDERNKAIASLGNACDIAANLLDAATALLKADAMPMSAAKVVNDNVPRIRPFCPKPDPVTGKRTPPVDPISALAAVSEATGALKGVVAIFGK